MAQTYSAAFQTYNLGQGGMGFSLKKLQPGTKSYNSFLQAAENAEFLGVDFALYIKAQFVFFNRAFGRAPAIWEIASRARRVANSLERVKSYQREVANGLREASAVVVGKVIPAPRITVGARFQQSQRTLTTLMRNYNKTEEEILLVFGPGNSYFDKDWLKQNETYQRLMRDGQV
jgi:hypothetical protein